MSSAVIHKKLGLSAPDSHVERSDTNSSITIHLGAFIIGFLLISFNLAIAIVRQRILAPLHVQGIRQMAFDEHQRWPSRQVLGFEGS